MTFDKRRRWIILAAVFVSAFWPRWLPDDLPDHPLADDYREEALGTISWMRDNPVQRVFDLLLVQRWHLSDWREVPGSGEGGTSLPSLMDVRVTATALGPWGLPLGRLTIGCGGACAQVD